MSAGRRREDEDSTPGYPTPITHEGIEVTDVI